MSFLTLSCSPKKAANVSTDEESTLYTNTPEHIAPDYDEVWMMQGWVGFMGVFIGLRDQEYDYIFYSDTGARQATPYTGTYSRDWSSLKLHVEDTESDFNFYSTEWKFVREEGEVKLAAIDDLEKERDSGRWLRKVNLEAFRYLYDPEQPFLLQFNPHIEAEFNSKDSFGL